MPTNITGRDNYIMAQSLIYAIAHIQSLPPEKQEWSNMRDMCEIARNAIGERDRHELLFCVERHTGIAVDLYPDQGDTFGPNDDISDLLDSIFEVD